MKGLLIVTNVNKGSNLIMLLEITQQLILLQLYLVNKDVKLQINFITPLK